MTWREACDAFLRALHARRNAGDLSSEEMRNLDRLAGNVRKLRDTFP